MKHFFSGFSLATLINCIIFWVISNLKIFDDKLLFWSSLITGFTTLIVTIIYLVIKWVNETLENAVKTTALNQLEEATHRLLAIQEKNS